MMFCKHCEKTTNGGGRFKINKIKFCRGEKTVEACF